MIVKNTKESGGHLSIPSEAYDGGSSVTKCLKFCKAEQMLPNQILKVCNSSNLYFYHQSVQLSGGVQKVVRKIWPTGGSSLVKMAWINIY
ncbi:hypothetical protein SUGI_0638850 [Cryptomeria japonica]|nr:hypothetical protein SUGI_0638850 [Cryptomeria japonica]